MLVIERMVHRRPARSTPTPKLDEVPPHNARPRSSTTAAARTVFSDDVGSGAATVKTSGGAWAITLTTALAVSVNASTKDRKKRTIACLRCGSRLGNGAHGGN